MKGTGAKGIVTGGVIIGSNRLEGCWFSKLRFRLSFGTENRDTINTCSDVGLPPLGLGPKLGFNKE